MYKFILFFSLITYPLISFSLTTDDIVTEYVSLFKRCAKVGFYVCESKSFLKGSAKGVFYKPIQMQHVKLMEERYDNFIKKKYPKNYLQFSLIKTSMDFSSVPKFNLRKYGTSNITNISSMNSDQTIIKFTFKSAPPIYLSNEGKEFKIAIHPDEQKAAVKTKQYKTAYLAMLKANILRYHIIEAELLNLDRSTLNKNINEALAPLVKWVKGDKMPKVVQKFIKRDPKEIRKFYASIHTDKKAKEIILSKMKN